jgi:hypothetical protein
MLSPGRRRRAADLEQIAIGQRYECTAVVHQEKFALNQQLQACTVLAGEPRSRNKNGPLISSI